MQIRVLSFNVRTMYRDLIGKHWFIKRYNAIRKEIQHKQPEIICFQEMWWPATLWIPANYKRISSMFTGHPIYVHKDLNIAHMEDHKDHSVAAIRICGKYIRIFNAHSSWVKEKYIHTMQNLEAQSIKAKRLGEEFIACGDWNVEYKDHIRILYTGTMHVDCDTFKNYKTGKTAELDYFYVSSKRENDSIGMANTYSMSDHKPIYLDKTI